MEWFFTAAFFAGLVGSIAIRVPIQRKLKQTATRETRRPLTERALVGGAGLGMMVVPLVYYLTPLLDAYNWARPDSIGWVGVVLQVVGLWLFWRSHRDLGLNWSSVLEIRDEHKLVTNGIYARIRNPMYAAIILADLAQAALIPNVVAGLAGLAFFLPLYFLRIGAEERMMFDNFGVQWTEYVARSGRLLPKFGGRAG